MNKDNQLYQLIPAPAGDWQEGDILISIGADPEYHRLRPVKAQSGQLWRDLAGQLNAYLDGIEINRDNIGNIRRSCFMPWDCEWNGLVRDETARRERCESEHPPVPAQACACEGLRKALRHLMARADYVGQHHFGEDDPVGTRLIAVQDLRLEVERANEALAQSCQHSVSHSVQQPDLSGGVESRHAADLKQQPSITEALHPPVRSGSSVPPAQNISEKGGAIHAPTTNVPVPGCDCEDCQQPDLSGGSEKSDVSNKPTAAQSLRTTPVMDTSKSSDLPAQNTERGDASCPTMAQPTPGSKAGPESSNPPAAASEAHKDV